ncbi:hypothetical protein AAFF_G00119100 [Aldrovandia affinis]|uniref:ribonuclease H n=1 Tax=Aldrovandia affinis TaxID=143900 RepID=A0AAD7WAK3_9TELE|nr:hypothetical protein AAFF_G00119100 [Aldrovandia affinis]
MLFGLCNAQATFQRLMERVLAHIPRQHCIVYLDDLLVHASNFEGALCNLREVFAAIRQAGLRLNPKYQRTVGGKKEGNRVPGTRSERSWRIHRPG